MFRGPFLESGSDVINQYLDSKQKNCNDKEWDDDEVESYDEDLSSASSGCTIDNENYDNCLWLETNSEDDTINQSNRSLDPVRLGSGNHYINIPAITKDANNNNNNGIVSLSSHFQKQDNHKKLMAPSLHSAMTVSTATGSFWESEVWEQDLSFAPSYTYQQKRSSSASLESKKQQQQQQYDPTSSSSTTTASILGGFSDFCSVRPLQPEKQPSLNNFFGSPSYFPSSMYNGTSTTHISSSSSSRTLTTNRYSSWSAFLKYYHHQQELHNMYRTSDRLKQEILEIVEIMEANALGMNVAALSAYYADLKSNDKNNNDSEDNSDTDMDNNHNHRDDKMSTTLQRRKQPSPFVIPKYNYNNCKLVKAPGVYYHR